MDGKPLRLFPIPEKERLREVDNVNPLGICKGGCNRLCKIQNKTYQICEPCSRKYRYFGRECDVPNCEAISDGSKTFLLKEGKYVCGGCLSSWNKSSRVMYGNDSWKNAIYTLPDPKLS